MVRIWWRWVTVPIAAWMVTQLFLMIVGYNPPFVAFSDVHLYFWGGSPRLLAAFGVFCRTGRVQLLALVSQSLPIKNNKYLLHYPFGYFEIECSGMYARKF